MPRFLLVVLAVALLVLPATAEGQSSSRLRGIVALKSEANDLVTLRTRRQAVALRVRGSMSLIRVGQRVELRGSTLRTRGNGTRVLARNVSIVSSQSLSTSSTPRSDDDEQGDDEAEIKGKLTSLAPLTVTSSTRSLTCSVPSGGVPTGFAVGDFVEITCDRIGGSWMLRKLKHEDGAVDADDDDQNDDDHNGAGGDDEDEDDSRGSSGSGGDDDD